MNDQKYIDLMYEEARKLYQILLERDQHWQKCMEAARDSITRCMAIKALAKNEKVKVGQIAPPERSEDDLERIYEKVLSAQQGLLSGGGGEPQEEESGEDTREKSMEQVPAPETERRENGSDSKPDNQR